MYGPYAVTNCGEHDTAEYKLRTLHVSPLDNVSVSHPCPTPRATPWTCSLVWLGRMGDVWEQGH